VANACPSYVEWEKYPEKKKKAEELLAAEVFPINPEYQMGPIPGTNPVLEGEDYKAWHRAIGGGIAKEPDNSWETVLKEKHPEMLHLLQFPYNGEPPKRLVTARAITPNPLHFVRNHGGIPLIEKDKWKLDIDGLVKNPKTFTFEDITNPEKFDQVHKHITMQCSGTRRIEQISLYAGQGDEVPQAPWAEGAIGTAKYLGVSLKAVIEACGGLVKPAKHLEFYGADTYFKNDQGESKGRNRIAMLLVANTMPTTTPSANQRI
jgi:sulfite oxidase